MKSLWYVKNIYIWYEVVFFDHKLKIVCLVDLNRFFPTCYCLIFLCVYLFAFAAISFSFPIWLWQNGHETNCIEKKRIIV